MKWNFILRGITLGAGGWAGGQGLGETSWTLHSKPTLPISRNRGMGKSALLKTARDLCATEGGRLIIVEDGSTVAAWEWRDAGLRDPEASGHWEKVELDPQEFKGF